MHKMAKWAGKKRNAGLLLTGKESKDALGRLHTLKQKWHKRFFKTQGMHKDGHNYIAWSNLSGELKEIEFVYPDDAIRWLDKLKRKSNEKR